MSIAIYRQDSFAGLIPVLSPDCFSQSRSGTTKPHRFSSARLKKSRNHAARGGRRRLEAFAFDPFAFQLTGTANSFGLFTGTAFRRLFIRATELHFTEDTFTLHFLFQDFKGLIDIVVANGNLHVCYSLYMLDTRSPNRVPNDGGVVAHGFCYGKRIITKKILRMMLKLTENRDL